LSALTKILMVLLTIAAIFLSGIVVTYVANADNYKEKYDSLYTRFQTEQGKRASADQQLEKTTEQANRLEKVLNDKIASLNIKIEQLQGELDKAEREKAQLLQRVDGFAAEVKTFTTTNQNQTSLLDSTIKKWELAEANLIREQSQHKETARLLLEKLAIISTLDEKNKRLLEENAALQSRLDQPMRQYGKATAPPSPVTTIRDTARPVQAPLPTREIGLKGQIANVDIKNKMAEISIGKAHGVQENMRFHVTRGDQFICDIVILDVEPEKAVGRLELIQYEPQPGDNINTNL
jgi:outer membrane murein-binding lipoprotein Lpp